MKGKWLTGALVLAMAAVTLAGCGAKDETKEKVEQVTLNEVAHSIFYAPQYVAIEEGYFADEGIDLTLITGFGADKVLTAMISGEADIGFMGAEATVYAYLEGTADPVVNFAQLTQRAGNFVVGREKDNSFTWEKLKNKEGSGIVCLPLLVTEWTVWCDDRWKSAEPASFPDRRTVWCCIFVHRREKCRLR